MSTFCARIYRIIFEDGHFYIGSTKRSLIKRLKEHECEKIKNLEHQKKNNLLPQTRFDIYLTEHGWNNPTIEIHTECDVSSLKDLHDIEASIIQVHFDDPKCLNDRCRGKGLTHSEIKRLCWLEKQLNREEDPLRIFWIQRVIDNWWRGTIYGFQDAMNEFTSIPRT
jgi:hypothetical protein